MDIPCAVCGEPWDSYEVQHEFSKEERRRFRAGEGCPTCHFGEKKELVLSASEQADLTYTFLDALYTSDQ